MKYRIVKADKGLEILEDDQKIGTAKSVAEAHKKLRAHRGLPAKGSK